MGRNFECGDVSEEAEMMDATGKHFRSRRSAGLRSNASLLGSRRVATGVVPLFIS